MKTDVFNHGPAKLFMNTGFQVPGRPSMGSWVTYGIGSESRDLPGFVVLQSGSEVDHVPAMRSGRRDFCHRAIREFRFAEAGIRFSI